MSEEPRPTVRGRRLGSELRRLRDSVNKTTEDAAQALKCSRAKISRIETGASGIRRLDLGILLDLYGVTEQRDRDSLEALARDSRKRGWWHDYGDTIPPAYADFLGLEGDARYIRTWQPLVVPGLLQTEGYARALLEANPAAVRPERIDQLVRVRMERKDVLSKSDPARFWAIIWEPALRCPVGGRDVQRAQLDQLTKAAQLPNVTLQVVPMDVGATAGACGAFVMFGFTDSPTPGAVFLETLTSSHYLEQEAELDGYGLVFEYLRSAALSPAKSLDMISSIAAEP
ncbi:transcriptional regulator with XRE-family HTH domain [Kitasatospora sp. MAP12-15]|uniref:helix-turn-helix domain-containing protein n=1 Tax=unclassified Kitasatospora TaxID=2633591 RepID=UPI0024764871|nr:helix-turn-helix transcriptional regulator [Kitasatospora sp. MAP12-44]MDH6109043.1 transcriptional regulator with XRE-family HTH domain [Kitasatospora sp. MAP12-44]